jgi:hypothetical protein
MTKRNYISQEDFEQEFFVLCESNPNPGDLAKAVWFTYTIKRKFSGEVECSLPECGKRVLYSEAEGWIRIPQIQTLNEHKQWKDIFSEEKLFCSHEHHRQFVTGRY